MRRLSQAIAATFFLSVPAFAGNEIFHEIERMITPDTVIESINRGDYPVTTENYTGIEDYVDIQTIINLGKRAYTVIAANKPVVNIKYDYANAVPEGITIASQLAGFSDLRYQSFRLKGKNLYGFTVYDVVFTLVHQFGGHYEGAGHYLANVAVIPSRVDVLWGYQLDMNVNKISTLNVGEAHDPVASLLMELSIDVNTVIKSSKQTWVYQFRGDRATVNATSL